MLLLLVYYTIYEHRNTMTKREEELRFNRKKPQGVRGSGRGSHLLSGDEYQIIKAWLNNEFIWINQRQCFKSRENVLLVKLTDAVYVYVVESDPSVSLSLQENMLYSPAVSATGTAHLYHLDKLTQR